MALSFNLLDEPWIPCTWKQGGSGDVSIRRLLREAERIRDVGDGSPLLTVALLRFLVALVTRGHGSWRLDSWRALWEQGHFRDGRLEAYLSAWESRFDLFDATHPFFQTPGATGELLAATELDPARTTATNIAHFSKDRDGRTGLSFAECARGLILLPAFCTAGGAGKAPSLNGRNMNYVMLRGDNLFQTLMMNVPLWEFLPELPGIANPADSPLWEGISSRSGAIGILEGLTWRPRSVNLRPGLIGPDKKVRRIVFASGEASPRDREWLDPFVLPSGVPSPEGSPASFTGQWRDTLLSILAAAGGEETAPIIAQARAMREVILGKTVPSVYHASFHVRQATPLLTRGFVHGSAYLHENDSARVDSFAEAIANSRQSRRREQQWYRQQRLVWESFARKTRRNKTEDFASQDWRVWREDALRHTLAYASEAKPVGETLAAGLREYTSLSDYRAGKAKVRPDSWDADGASRFATALFALSSSDLSRLRQFDLRARGSNVSAYDLFNAIFRPLRDRTTGKQDSGEATSRVHRPACFLAFSLFPWNSLEGGKGFDFGASLRAGLRSTTGARQAGYQRAFFNLLDVGENALYPPLLDLVRFLGHSRTGVPIDWPQFIRDIAQWSRADKAVQDKWAESFTRKH